MEEVTIYEDLYLKNKVLKAITAQNSGKYALAGDRDDIPLPSRYGLGMTLNRGNYPHDYVVGIPEPIGYVDYDPTISGYVYTRIPGCKLPKALENYKVLQLAVAVIDVASRTATIQVGDLNITFPGVEVWKGSYDVLKEINTELARLGTGVVVWRTETVPDPDESHKPFQGASAVSNGQVSLTATGYAYSRNFAMVYLNVVGYKTSIESMRATIIQNKIIRLSGPDHNGNLLPCPKYQQIWQAMPEYTSHNSAFIAHQALPGKWMPEDTELYVLIFRDTVGDPQAELRRQFAARLNEALEIPIQPEWADALWKAGKANRFIQDMKTGGDCLAGVEVNLQASWNELVQKMLEEEALIVA